MNGGWAGVSAHILSACWSPRLGACRRGISSPLTYLTSRLKLEAGADGVAVGTQAESLMFLYGEHEDM